MEQEPCSYPVGDCVFHDHDKKQKKMLHGIFQDFFRDSTLFFKGRVDDGNITMKELNDYITAWVEKHLG